MRTEVDGPAIEQGYAWSLRLRIVMTPGPFPSGCVVKGHVKAKRTDSAALCVLSTADGSLVRVSDTELDIKIPESATATFPLGPQGAAGSVVMDLVRTDTDPVSHLQFALTVPVVQPVTRRGAL